MKALDGIRARVRALVLGMILLVLLVGSAGLLGVVFATDRVGRLADELAPVEQANANALHDLTDAESSVNGWSMTGDRSFLDRYRAAVDRLAMHQEALVEGTAGDPRLHSLAREQRRASAAWIERFARVQIDLPPGRAQLRTELFAEGAAAFERVHLLDDQINSEVDDQISGARDAARDQVGWTVGGVALVALLGALVALFFGRLIGHEIVTPLISVHRTVSRLAAGEHSVRVKPEGPREARKVAHAINALANENERARLREQQVVDQMRDLDRAKTSFISNVSHELRTPLTSIGGYVELFEEDLGTLTAEQALMLAAVTRNVDRLKSLIEDLLMLSNTESMAFNTAFDKLDLSHLTSDVAYDMAATAAERGITITEVSSGQPVRMLGDSGQLSRAVLNLVANAVKFSPDHAQVTLSLAEHDGSAVIEVADHGIGIPIAELPKLATRFFRASNAVDAEIAGTGLGLRIVQTIADNHDGRLEIESVEGSGTTTRLVLPMRQGNTLPDRVLTSR